MKITTVFATAAIASTLTTVAVLSLNDSSPKVRLDTVSSEEDATTTSTTAVVTTTTETTVVAVSVPIEERVENLEDRVTVLEATTTVPAARVSPEPAPSPPPAASQGPVAPDPDPPVVTTPPEKVPNG